MTKDKAKELFNNDIVKYGLAILLGGGSGMVTDQVSEGVKQSQIEELQKEKEVIFRKLGECAGKQETTDLLKAVITNGNKITENKTKIDVYHK